MQAPEYRKGFEQLRVRLIQYCNHKHPPGNGSIQFCNHQLPPTFGGLFKGSGVKKVEKFLTQFGLFIYFSVVTCTVELNHTAIH